MAALGAFVTIDNIKNSPITDPAPVLQKGVSASNIVPNIHELDKLSFGNRYRDPSRVPSPHSLKSTTPNELEMSQPPSPVNEDAADVVQTLSNPPMNKYRLLSACLMCFGNGINDSAPGALLPYIENHYGIGYALTSTIFVTNAVGFISAFPLTYALQARLGRAKMLVLAEALMVTSYVMLVCTPPFAVVVLSFFFSGLGMAFNLALNNTFVANLANPTTTLGFFHGSYGIGGTVGPLIATALVSRGGGNRTVWSTFYFIPLSVTALNALIAYLTFRRYEADNPAPTPLRPASSHPEREPSPGSKSQLLKESLRNKSTILGALFIFAYQGAEVSISGWIISFLISYRHSEPSRVGYVTAGFWAGITLGRFLLSHPAHKIGEKTAVAALTVGAIAFQLLVWQIPNAIGEAVAVSIVGLLLGPIYPCATTVISRLVGRRLQMSSLAGISALGSSGGAVAPFFTGLLAQQTGTWVLHPICIGLFASMLGCWWGMPKVAKRRE